MIWSFRVTHYFYHFYRITLPLLCYGIVSDMTLLNISLFSGHYQDRYSHHNYQIVRLRQTTIVAVTTKRRILRLL